MWNYEYTDTFCGEANYCWARRGTLPTAKTRGGAIRMAKSAVGLTGARCRVSDYGDDVRLDPIGSATVLFVLWSDSGSADET